MNKDIINFNYKMKSIKNYNNKSIKNYNNKGQSHGYQQFTNYNDRIYHRGNWKNNKMIAYNEWHLDITKETRYYII